jgi:hypothetical protein
MMKPILLLLALAISATAAELQFAWDPNATNEQIIAYRLYSSPNVAGPYTLAAETGTNTTATITNAILGQAFYYMTASNFWGESERSIGVSTPAVALPVNTLSLKLLSAGAKQYVLSLSKARRVIPMPPK